MKKTLLTLTSFLLISHLAQAEQLQPVKDSPARVNADAEAWRDLTQCIRDRQNDGGSLAVFVHCFSDAVKERARVEPTLKK